MIPFIRKILIFSVVPVLILIWVEVSVGYNSFSIRKNLIEAHGAEFEILVLGSSHSNRSINPNYLDNKTLSLAHGGTPLEVQFKLFDRYINELPNLKLISWEISYPALEFNKNIIWENTICFDKYYDIDLYPDKKPWKHFSLFSSNPKFYFQRFVSNITGYNKLEYNQHGFLTKSINPYKKLNYDLEKIKNKMWHLRKYGAEENLSAYKKQCDLMDQYIKKCLNLGIEVILLAPPNFFLYNDNMEQDILYRRNEYFSKYASHDNVHVMSYERLYEKEIMYFTDEHHMSQEGAKAFTTFLNEKIKNILN